MSNTTKKVSFGYKQMCPNKHIRFLSPLKGIMTSGKPLRFKITSASFCEDNRRLYLRYFMLDSTDTEHTSIQESYNIDDNEFKVLCYNLFNPYAGEMLSLYEKDFLNITGTAYIHFIDFVPYIDTVTIRVPATMKGGEN